MLSDTCRSKVVTGCDEPATKGSMLPKFKSKLCSREELGDRIPQSIGPDIYGHFPHLPSMHKHIENAATGNAQANSLYTARKFATADRTPSL
jgi:hypothetical protein